MKDAQENSFQSQQEYFTEYIQRHSGWVFAGMYADDGISGLSIRKRDDFNRMVADALDGKIDLILTKSLSRFARNTVDALTAIRSLKAAGVAVYFQKENINTMDNTGEFLITLMSSFAEEESRSISENVTWAVRHRYAQGIYHLPGLLLGYQRSQDGEIQVDEAGARVVRFIYLLALAGKSSTDICRILMDYGIPSPGQGHRWEPHTVRSILKNEKYMGDAILQKEITVDFLTKTRKPNEGEAPQYYVENGHPGIVSKSVWQEVQATWTDASRRNCTFSPIANKIICGDCGGRYGRKTWHSTTYRDAVWECNGKKAGRTKCKCRHIYTEELDTAIRRSMHHLLKTHQNIIPDCADMLSQALREISSDARSVLNDIAHGKLDIQIDESLSAIRRYFMHPEFKAVLEMVGPEGEFIDTCNGRIINPGHCIETSWFIMEEARHRGWDKELVQMALQILEWSWDWGWDKEYGGIINFRDCRNFPVQDYSQDMKFWWPQTEAIIATLYAYQATKDEKYLEMHKQISDWTYAHFPDRECGEWYGYLHRDGTVAQPAKGNLFKGPFHIPRMMICGYMLCEAFLMS